MKLFNPPAFKKFREQLLAEDFFLFVMSMWLTILVVRTGIYEYKKIFHAEPAIFVHGIHIHHFVMGLVSIAASIAILRRQRKSRFLALILLGIGSGLFVDEAWIVATKQFWPQIYWGLDSLALLLLLGCLPFLLLLGLDTQPLKNLSTEPPRRKHENPQNPAISVVIPAFNEEKFLASTLQSLLRQTHRQFELLVVDNGSTDRTPEIARGYGARIISEPQKGVGFARDTGFRQAGGEIVATTDADTVVPADWVEKIVRKFENQPELVAFGGLYRLYSGPLLARFAIRYLGAVAWRLDRFFSGGWSLPGANLAVRKSVFLRAGGFKTSLKLSEDAELSQRLKHYGAVVLDPEFRVATSGRRFRHGLFVALATYAPNVLARSIWKKEKFNRLPAVRKEARPVSASSVVPLAVAAVFLFALFSWANPQIQEAKSIRAVNHAFASMSQKYHSAKSYTVNVAVNFTRHHHWHLRHSQVN